MTVQREGYLGPFSPGGPTMVGEVVFGWGSSRPVPTPRSQSASALFKGAAGAKSGTLETRPDNRRRCYQGVSTSMGELIHRKRDSCGENPHMQFVRQFNDHAGVRTTERIFGETRETRRKGGASLSKLSSIDTIIYGRDLDGSGDNMHGTMMEKFHDHAGMRRKEVEVQGKQTKPGLRAQSTVDTLLYGRDIDGTGDGNAHEDVMAERNAGAAGVPSGDKARGRKNVLLTQPLVAEVVFNKHHPQPEMDDFTASYQDYAGIRSGQCIMRNRSCPPGQLTARSAATDAGQGGAPEQPDPPAQDLANPPSGTEIAQKQQISEPLQQPPRQPREAWAAEPPDAPPPAAPLDLPLEQPPPPPQRANPFGKRRPSSASSCGSAARGGRRAAFDPAASTSSCGSQRPRWR